MLLISELENGYRRLEYLSTICWASFNFALLDGRLASCIIQAYIVIN